MRYILPVFFFLMLSPSILFSQLDVVHYIPPLHFISNSQIQDHYIYVSTPTTTPFELTIEDGSGNILVTTNISNAASYIYTVGNGQINGSQTFVPVDSLNTVLTHSGLKIHGSSPFYVSLRARSNSQAESLTSKGSAALGTEFRFGGFPQFTAGSAQDRNFTAGIMATEDNTIVTIDDYDTDVVFSGNPTVTSPSLTINLNEGECYVVSGDNYVPANLDGFMGAHIVSDKPIVLNNGNLLGNIHPTETSRDMGIDQSVPVSIIGKEYIVISGDGVSELERPIIIAHHDNTDVFINGGPAVVTTLQAGDYYLVPNTYYQGLNHQNMFIETTNEVYLYQALAGGSSTATGGLNFIPPLSCFLPDTIDFIPNINSIGSVNYNGGVMLFTNEGADLKINGVTQTGAEAVPSAPWETYKIQDLTGDITITSSHTLAAGIYGYSGAAGFAGYFSGFSTMPVNSEFYYLDTCLGMSTEFIGEIDSTTYIDSIVWNFGDPESGVSNHSLLGSPYHTYNTGGIYTVQMIVYRCENDTIDHNITIQALPTIIPVLDQTFCAQNNTTTIAFSGNPPETNYTWVNDNNATGIGLNGTGNINPFMATNSALTPILSSLMVTPEIAGCYGDSETFTITINPILDSETDTTVCATELPFDWNGLTFSSAGSQTATLISVVMNCDSLATLEVSVNPILASNVDTTICSTELPFTWNDLIFTTAASQTAILTSFVTACDSLVTLNITEIPTIVSTTNLTVCSNELPLEWNGLTFLTAGSQTATFMSLLTSCDSLATLNLSVNSTLVSNTDTTVCSSLLPFDWNGITFTESESQTATLVSQTGCDSLATLNVTVNPTLASSTDSSVCNTDLPFEWNGLIFETAASQTAILSGILTGCDSLVTLNLTVNPTPIAYIPNDTSLCANENTNSYAFSSSVAGSSFSWVNNNTATGLPANGIGNFPPFNVQNATNNPIISEIHVTPSANSCNGDGRLFIITVNPLPFVDAGPDQTLCLGDSTLLNMIGIDAYLWNNNIANNTFAPLTLGGNEFTLTATDMNGCQDSDTIVDNVIELPIAALQADVSQGFPILNVNFSNNSINANYYHWDFGNGTAYNVTDLSTQSIEFIDAGAYSVRLISSNGICEDTAKTTIIVAPFPEPFIHFPNVFSPNSDGVNDFLEYNYENIEEFELHILNRWGNLVYQASEISSFWDGNINNKGAKEGVYFYYYSAKGIGEKIITGDGFITLLR